MRWFVCRNVLYCRLTGKYLNRIPSHVERHMAGRRFTKAKEKCKLAGHVYKLSIMPPLLGLDENEGRELRNEPSVSSHQQKEDGEKAEEEKMDEEDVCNEEDCVDVKESIVTAVDRAPGTQCMHVG